MERKAKLQTFRANKMSQQKVFQKQMAQSNSVVQASMRISHIIAKKMKPFSDGEYIKECLLAAVEVIMPRAKVLYQDSGAKEGIAVAAFAINSEHIAAQVARTEHPRFGPWQLKTWAI